jgi:adenosylhomocysteinase
MPYHLEHTQLRVVRKYTCQQRNKVFLAQARFIVLEHILPTTEGFIMHLREAGAEIFAVLAKPYSIDEQVAARLERIQLPITRKTYDELETTTFLDDLLAAAVEKSKSDKKQIIILEVGGYFAAPLTRMPAESSQFIAGVVEDTTFGHNRYTKLLEQVPVPVFSVARSALKEIEARFVGRDAVSAIDSVLRDLGVSVAGRNALVIGYGMIGSNVARALQRHDLNVAVYDKHDHRNLRAFVDGFSINTKRKLIEQSDIIFSATADVALTWPEIEECKDNVILASVGSKDTEFDIAQLKEQALATTAIGPHIFKYRLSNSKNIMVVRDGTAVNFLMPSLPVEILDLVFSEILLCVMLLLKRQPIYPPGELWAAPETFLNSISEDWLRIVNAT